MDFSGVTDTRLNWSLALLLGLFSFCFNFFFDLLVLLSCGLHVRHPVDRNHQSVLLLFFDTGEMLTIVSFLEFAEIGAIGPLPEQVLPGVLVCQLHRNEALVELQLEHIGCCKEVESTAFRRFVIHLLSF